MGAVTVTGLLPIIAVTWSVAGKAAPEVPGQNWTATVQLFPGASNPQVFPFGKLYTPFVALADTDCTACVPVSVTITSIFGMKDDEP
jgi:hypothetical protein